MTNHILSASIDYPATSVSLSLPSPPQLPPLSPYLPSEPGVYWFLGANNQVLYVGKSVNLKNRLLSYSRTSQLLDRTKKLVQNTHFTRFITTSAEIEALLLEAELISAYQPEFNIALKDSKSNLYIAISDQDYPTVTHQRRSDYSNTPAKYIFGPYPSSNQVKQVLKLIRPIFKWCDHPKSDRPCFYYHINQCSGACIRNIDLYDYQENISKLRLFLSGKHRILIRNIKREIRDNSSKHKYEAAHKLKLQLETLEYISQYYRIKRSHQILPNLSEDIVSHQLIHAQKILKKYLSLPSDYSLSRIECYDISNYQDQHITGSMVVFTDGVKDSSAYRQFKIKSSGSTSDSSRIQEVIKRRMNHSEWPFPNLIIVDGSKAQISSAKNVIKQQIPLIGLAKKPDRLVFPTSNTVALKNYQYYKLNPDDPATRLFVSIRDESHRFAKKYSQKLLVKSVIN